MKIYEKVELEIILFESNNVMTGDSGTCLAPGTKITMADGSFKNVEDIIEGDMVMTFDHESGCFVGREVNMTFASDDEDYIFSLYFSDKTKLQLIHKHCFYEQESRKYVCLTIDNAEQFIGKHFYSAKLKGFVELLNVTKENKKSHRYTLYTKCSINYIANGLLNMSDDVAYLLNLYEFDENLKVDKEVLDRDIQKYGIFECNGECGFSKEEYENWNSRYLNIAVGKGLVTWTEILRQHFESNNMHSVDSYKSA